MSETRQRSADHSAFDRLVAKAWSDPSFKARLLRDPTAALATMGVAVPAGMTVKVLENQENLDHVVIPVRPTGELSNERIATATGVRLESTEGGRPVFMPFCVWCPFCLDLIEKAWRDPAFKAKLLADPASAVDAAGADVREGEEIVVAENTDTLIHLVLPAQPAGPLSDEALAAVSAGTGPCWLYKKI